MKLRRKSAIFGVLIAILGISMLEGCKKEVIGETETDPVVIDHSVEDAPKTIESNHLTVFLCTFTVDESNDDTSVPEGTYQLEARLESANSGDFVKGSYRFGDFSDMEGIGASFEATPAFMEKLQMIISKNNMAKDNGKHLTTEGMSEDSGCSYYLEYADGEYVSAGDNAQNFISSETMEELYYLFYVESGVKTIQENELTN